MKIFSPCFGPICIVKPLITNLCLDLNALQRKRRLPQEVLKEEESKKIYVNMHRNCSRVENYLFTNLSKSLIPNEFDMFAFVDRLLENRLIKFEIYFFIRLY